MDEQSLSMHLFFNIITASLSDYFTGIE